MKSNHDLVVLNRDQLCEENVQRDSKIMIKRNYKDEIDCGTGHSEIQERHGSFLRSAILKDEERRQIQMQDASKRKDFHGSTTTRKYGEQIIDNEKEERTLQFRRFVEQTSEVEDDIKGESQNEDDERDDDESEDDDSDDEKDEADEHGTASKKRKTYRVKPDPKYNGMKYSFSILSSINTNKSYHHQSTIYIKSFRL